MKTFIDLNEITGEIERITVFECAHCNEESERQHVLGNCIHCDEPICPACLSNDCPEKDD